MFAAAGEQTTKTDGLPLHKMRVHYAFWDARRAFTRKSSHRWRQWGRGHSSLGRGRLPRKYRSLRRMHSPASQTATTKTAASEREPLLILMKSLPGQVTHAVNQARRSCMLPGTAFSPARWAVLPSSLAASRELATARPTNRWQYSTAVHWDAAASGWLQYRGCLGTRRRAVCEWIDSHTRATNAATLRSRPASPLFCWTWF